MSIAWKKSESRRRGKCQRGEKLSVVYHGNITDICNQGEATPKQKTKQIVN